MKWESLEQAARALDEAALKEGLLRLVNDPHCPALVRLLLEQAEMASDSSCQLQFAGQPGMLAHAAGVRYAVLELKGKLKEACETPRKRGPAKPDSI
jgi:hypothetical protein